MTNDLNDSLDALFAGDTGPVRIAAQVDRPAAREFIERTTAPGFVQKCNRCRGTGQTPWGVCFKCKGAKQKVFKTSPEARAKASVQRAERKAVREVEALDAWKAANPGAHEWLVATAPRWDLAQSLLNGLQRFGSLTEKQMAIVTNGMARDAARAQERAQQAQPAPQVDAGKIEQAFATAREKAARPGQMGVMVKPIRLTSGDLTIRFTPGSVGSQWEGMLFAKTEDGKKLGHIKNGKFQRKFDCTDAEQAAVLDCASDPEKAAVAFGKAWSKCGICGQGLLNDESIARGIGPICAEKFGW